MKAGTPGTEVGALAMLEIRAELGSRIKAQSPANSEHLCVRIALLNQHSPECTIDPSAKLRDSKLDGSSAHREFFRSTVTGLPLDLQRYQVTPNSPCKGFNTIPS